MDASSVTQTHMLSGLHVLVVDSNDDVLSDLDLMLQGAGLRVTAVKDPEAALTLPTVPPRVIVTERSLQGRLDGEAFIAEARQRWSGIGAVLLSGIFGEADPASQCNAFIAMPLHTTQLLAAIQRAVECTAAMGAAARETRAAHERKRRPGRASAAVR